ncbi:MAG: GAF domain-containing protein [Caldilineaceae bacterium]
MHCLHSKLWQPRLRWRCKTRLFTAEQNRYEVAEALRLSTSTLTLDLNLPSLLHGLLERLQRVVPFDSTTCFLLKDNAVQAVAMLGVPDADSVRHHSFPIDEHVVQMISERKPIVVEDVAQTTWFQGWGGTGATRGWMAVPLIHRGQFIGHISLDSLQPGTYGPHQAEVAQAFANQAAVTIINARLLQDSRRAAAEQWTVSQILRQLNATSTVADILPATAWGLRSLVQCDAVELAVFDADGLEASALRHTYNEYTDAVENRHAYAVSDSAGAQWNLAGDNYHIEPGGDDETLSLESIDIEHGYTVQLAVPLQVGRRVLGSLRLLWRSPFAADTINMTTISQIADAVAMTTEKNQLFGQTRRRVEEMETIGRLTTTLRPLETQQDILNISLSFVQKTFDCGVVRLYLGENDDHLALVAAVGKPSTTMHTFPRHGSILGHIMQTAQPLLSHDYQQDPLVHPQVFKDWRLLGVSPIAAIFAPVFAGANVIGVIAAYCFTKDRDYTDDDLHLLSTIAGIIGTALHRSSIVDTMEQRVVERTRQLADANERLQELDRLKSEFIANISHELRTPLTNIRFYIDLLRRGRAEKQGKYLQTLENEAQHLHRLIESVLDLSRLNAARTQGLFFEVTHFDLAALLQDTCSLYEQQARAKGIELNYAGIDKSLWLNADRSQINQVIATLLTNAIVYTQPGGQVELSAGLSHNDGIQVAIRDSGIGIPAAEIPHIFERFYRGAQVTESGIPGAGLGLSIAKEILELHGGTISVNSTPGQGTRVQIWLPRSRPLNELITPTENATAKQAIAEKAKESNDAS